VKTSSALQLHVKSLHFPFRDVLLFGVGFDAMLQLKMHQ